MECWAGTQKQIWIAAMLRIMIMIIIIILYYNYCRILNYT